MLGENQIKKNKRKSAWIFTFFLGTSNMIMNFFLFFWFTQILIYSFIHSMMIWLHRLLKSKFSSHFFFFFFLLLLMILWLLLLSMMITAIIMLFRIQIKHHHHVSWQKKNPNKSKWIKFIPSFIHCGCCEFSISRKKNENEKNF